VVSDANPKNVPMNPEIAQQCRHVHTGAIPNGADQNVGWLRVGMAAVMAKVIAFYVLDTFREARIQRLPERRGKVIEFPATEITGPTAQLNGGRQPLWRMRSGDGRPSESLLPCRRPKK
jgi:hypothetical protein